MYPPQYQIYPTPPQYVQAPSAPPMEDMLEAEMRRLQQASAAPVPGSIPKISAQFFETFETDSSSNGGNHGTGGSPGASGGPSGSPAGGSNSDGAPSGQPAPQATKKPVDGFRSILRKHEDQALRQAALSAQIVALSGVNQQQQNVMPQQDSPGLYPSLPQQMAPVQHQPMYAQPTATQMRREPPKMTFGSQYSAAAAAQNAYIQRKK